MTTPTLLAFAAATAVFAASPGPGILAASATSLNSGVRPALALSAGIIAGDLVYLLFALFGLAAVAEHLGDFFVFVRYAGAAYLVYLGVMLWRAPDTWVAPPAGGRISPFGRGVLISLGNPKVMAFYLGFLPAFWPLGALTGQDLAIIIATVVAVLALVLAAYVIVADRSRHWLRPRTVRVLNRLTAVILVAAGVKAATP